MSEQYTATAKQEKLDVALAEYLEFIKADYASWEAPMAKDDAIMVQVKKDSIEKFRLELSYGQKFIKVIRTDADGSHRSVHSFVDFEGNIWKAASWKAPAKNFTRGSVFDKASYEKRIRWSGVN